MGTNHQKQFSAQGGLAPRFIPKPPSLHQGSGPDEEPVEKAQDRSTSSRGSMFSASSLLSSALRWGVSSTDRVANGCETEGDRTNCVDWRELRYEIPSSSPPGSCTRLVKGPRLDAVVAPLPVSSSLGMHVHWSRRFRGAATSKPRRRGLSLPLSAPLEYSLSLLLSPNFLRL